MHEPLRRAIKLFAPLLLLGLGYLILYTVGLRIPCLIHMLTGFYCPGCGVSRMCVALLQLDFATAFRCNPGVMLLLPPVGLALLPGVVSYIRTGVRKSWRGEQAVLYTAVVLLVIYAVLRNIPAFWFLRPQA